MSTIKVQNIYETTNFFTDYFLSRTGVMILRKTVFHVAKGGLLHCKRLPFSARYAIFRNIGNRLSTDIRNNNAEQRDSAEGIKRGRKTCKRRKWLIYSAIS